MKKILCVFINSALLVSLQNDVIVFIVAVVYHSFSNGSIPVYILHKLYIISYCLLSMITKLPPFSAGFITIDGFVCKVISACF